MSRLRSVMSAKKERWTRSLFPSPMSSIYWKERLWKLLLTKLATIDLDIADFRRYGYERQWRHPSYQASSTSAKHCTSVAPATGLLYGLLLPSSQPRYLQGQQSSSVQVHYWYVTFSATRPNEQRWWTTLRSRRYCIQGALGWSQFMPPDGSNATTVLLFS